MLSLIRAPLGKFINKWIRIPLWVLTSVAPWISLVERRTGLSFSSCFLCFRRIFGGQDIDEEFRTWKAIKTSLIYKTLLRWRFMRLLNIFWTWQEATTKNWDFPKLCDYQLAVPPICKPRTMWNLVSRHFRVSIAVSLLRRINRVVLGSDGRQTSRRRCRPAPLSPTSG